MNSLLESSPDSAQSAPVSRSREHWMGALDVMQKGLLLADGLEVGKVEAFLPKL